MIQNSNGAAVMIVDYSTHDTMTKIHKYTPKLNIDDANRVAKAIDHYESYIDYDELMRRTQSGSSSLQEPVCITSTQFTNLR